MWKILLAAGLAAVVYYLLPAAVEAPPGDGLPRMVALLAPAVLFVSLLAGTGLYHAALAAPPPGAAARIAHRFGTAFFLLVLTVLSILQTNHRRPPECAGLDSEDVEVLLDRYRPFTVAASSDSKYLYAGFDYGEDLYRVPLNKGTRPAEKLPIGRFGAMRLRVDPEARRLYIPVRSNYPLNRMVVVDERTFGILEESGTPPGWEYGVFDMALDRKTGREFFLGRDARILVREPGSPAFREAMDLLAVFPGRELMGHKVMRIEVNESRRVAYVCPYPSLRSPRVVVEIDIDRFRINRVKEFTAQPSAVRVIEGGRKILVALPMGEKVLLLDADSFETVREYPAGFTARDISVDEELRVMAVGNFFTGTVNLVDLDSGKELREYKVGRGVRSVEIDADSGSVFAATLCGAVRMDLPPENVRKEGGDG